jgi:hypothetical protein
MLDEAWAAPTGTRSRRAAAAAVRRRGREVIG